MKRVVAVAVAMGALPAWAASATPAAGPCATAGRTLAADGAARVYSSGASVFGCAFKTGTPIKLGSAKICNLTPCPERYALSGTVLAYGLNRFGVDGSFATVVVRQLTNGRMIHQDPAVSRGVVEGVMSAASLVVKRDGSDAWIGTDNSIVGHGSVVEVHRHDKRGAALLASGGAVKPGSLRLRDSRLSWRAGGGIRHATLR